MPATVVASYSRADEGLVTALVKGLRLGGGGVFLDTDTIEPGVRWRDSLEAGLAECRVLVLFWCLHSAESPEVRWEYTRAAELGKRVAPVLLDDTPLAPGLDAY